MIYVIMSCYMKSVWKEKQFLIGIQSICFGQKAFYVELLIVTDHFQTYQQIFHMFYKFKTTGRKNRRIIIHHYLFTMEWSYYELNISVNGPINSEQVISTTKGFQLPFHSISQCLSDSRLWSMISFSCFSNNTFLVLSAQLVLNRRLVEHRYNCFNLWFPQNGNCNILVQECLWSLFRFLIGHLSNTIPFPSWLCRVLAFQRAYKNLVSSHLFIHDGWGVLKTTFW